jgi:hypothetical protein
VRLSKSGDRNVKPATKTFPFFPVYANASSTTSLTTDVATAMAGSTVTLTATVITPVSGHQPNGQTVTFLDGGTILGTGPLSNPVGFGGGSFGLSAVLPVTNFAGGQHNLVAKYAGDAVRTASDSTGTPTIVMIMDCVVQVFPSTLTIQDGSSGAASFTLVPLGGFSQPVQLSCGTLPANVNCNFNKSTVTLDETNPSV